MIPVEKWRWYGHAGHLIVADWCRFHLCTEIGNYLVSTVGEYVPDEGVREIIAKNRGVTLAGKGNNRRADFLKKVGFVEIGANRLYETYVFLVNPDKRCQVEGCKCGMPEFLKYHEIDGAGYNIAGDATRGHMDMCRRVAAGVYDKEAE